MSVIAIVSMKGGVGKTSTTANLAAALAATLGPRRVSVVDLDPQNALHWHFGLDIGDADGICEQSLRDAPWTAVAHESAFDVTCLPYGAGEEASREAFESLLAHQPDWLARQIASTGLDRNAVVLIDSPPGPSAYLRQVFACADLVLVVLLADAGSYATIPAMESWIEDMAARDCTPPCVYLLNQIDAGDALSRDVTDMLREHLGERLAPVRIHRDESVSEALAFQQPVVIYDPHGQASHDLSRLASWTIDVLNR
jgi:cellulose synthase operon protein YhjQ